MSRQLTILLVENLQTPLQQLMSGLVLVVRHQETAIIHPGFLGRLEAARHLFIRTFRVL